MTIPPTIAFTLNTAWNIVNFRMGLVRAFKQLGYRVIAIAPPDDYAEQLRQSGVEFIPLRQLARKGTNPLQELRLVRELRSIYRRERVTVVLQYTIKPVIYGTVAAQGSDTRVINTITGLGYAFLSRGVVNKVVQRLYRYALVHADRVFFQNQDDRKLFVQRRMVSATSAGVVPGSGIDTERFQPASNGDTNEGPTVRFLFIGRLLTDKGVGELFEAAATVSKKYSDVEFHVVGAIDTDNPAAIGPKVLQQYVDDGTIIYHGQVSDTRPYIERATVVVLPSYREGLPRVMLEGMAMGKPLITTDVPGCRDTVREGVNGYLVPVRDAGALAAALERMIALPPAERRAMGRAGRKLAVEVFAEDKIVDHYLTEVRRLIGR